MNSAPAFVNVVIPNSPPVATADTVRVDEDTPLLIHMLNNDSDPDGDPLRVTSIAATSHGTLILNADGYTANYTPVLNFNGTDQFRYTISDGDGGTATAMVHITINAVNDAPVAVDDVYLTDEINGVRLD